MVVWNKGLNKEMSQKVLDMSKKISNNAKINPNYGMKGRHHTDSMKIKLRNNKNRANKISNTMKEKFIIGELKIPNNKGKKMSEEFKEKLRKSKTKKHAENISLGLKKAYEEGRIKNWSKGLTEKVDNRLKLRNLKSRETHLKLRLDKNSIYNTDEFFIRKSAGHQGIPLDEWNGFMSEKGYLGFTENFKYLIRERDNFKCLVCDIQQKKLKHSLHIHHINYDKKLSILENCVSLCLKCHTLTNHHRKYWKTFFQSLLSDKYNYKYKGRDIIIQVES